MIARMPELLTQLEQALQDNPVLVASSTYNKWYKKELEQWLLDFFTLIQQEILLGKSIRIKNFGIFYAHPITKTLRFRSSQYWKTIEFSHLKIQLKQEKVLNQPDSTKNPIKSKQSEKDLFSPEKPKRASSKN